tara:strand:- start:246 stop:383 length:138 start_codon:yes stop_codon:yes gene_type:complete
MKHRINSDRRDSDRRIEADVIEVDRRFTQRRSGLDRREILSGQTA